MNLKEIILKKLNQESKIKKFAGYSDDEYNADDIQVDNLPAICDFYAEKIKDHVIPFMKSVKTKKDCEEAVDMLHGIISVIKGKMQ
jgi:hypothetical protein